MGLHFSTEEFSKRKQDVLKSMKEQNLDALLMFRQESMYWLTGYDTFGYVFFQTLILDQRGNIILLTRAPDLRQAQNTSNIKDIRIWVDQDGINPTDDLKQILNELDLKDKNIGVEYEAYGMTGRNALRLNKSLENYCNVEDQSELITKLRVIKSDEELVYVKKAAELADRALDEAWRHTKAGASEADLNTNESMLTGSNYPDATLDGTHVSIGFERESGDFAVRLEAGISEYDDVTVTGTDGDGDANTITVNGLDGQHVRLSLVRAF